MAHTVFADRVKETTTTTGTGTINLGGAVSGYQTFVAGIGNGHYTYYSIFHQSANEWEVGIGVITDAATDTLSRDTVISSSNAGSLVNFSAGTKDVICTQPASKSVIIDGDSNVEITANITATSFDGSGAALTALNASNVSSGTLADARLTGNVVLTSGATFTGNVSLGDNDFINVGASNDLQIYHDVSNSYIKDAGSGKLKILSNELNINNAADTANLIIAKENAEVKLNYNGAVKLATTSSGIDVTGTATATTFSGSGASLTTLNASNVSSGTLDSARLSGDVVLTSGATFTGNVALGDLDYILMGATGEYQIYHDHANGVSNIKDVDVGGKINIEADTIQLTGPVTATANVSLGDDDFLSLGDSNEFSIVHEGATQNTYLRHTPAGAPLYIRADKLRVTNSGLTEYYITANLNADVSLNYNNVKKFETTSSGATVTGNLTADGVRLGDNESAQFGASSDLSIFHDAVGGGSYINESGTGNLFIKASNLQFQNTAGTGTYALFTDAGSVDLYYNNSKKFETTSTGIQTTGTVSVNGAYTLPTADGTSGQALTTNGSGALSFTTITGTTINNNADNRVITGSATANTLNGESGLTYNGSTLAVTGAITATGDITAFYTSDETLKTNIANIENPMNKVAQLNGVSYNWTEEAQAKYDHLNGDKEIGVIAQQVEKVLPEMVGTRDDGTKAVRYERMCALLIECVKDLQNQVNELKGTK